MSFRIVTQAVWPGSCSNHHVVVAMYKKCRPVAMLCFCLSGATAVVAAETAEAIIDKMGKSENLRRSHLKELWGSRRYTLRNERWNKNAEMQVEVQYRKGQGKSFQVLASTGSEDIQNRVFQKLLDTEVEASKSTDPDPSQLSNANYRFKMIGEEVHNGRRCHVVQMFPRKKSKFLIDGKAWVDAEDYALVRMEGRPSASLSFWVGRPYIVQEFAKVGEQWVASSNHSIADSRLFGRTELQIEYARYNVNGGGTTRVAAGLPVHPERSLD